MRVVRSSTSEITANRFFVTVAVRGRNGTSSAPSTAVALDVRPVAVALAEGQRADPDAERRTGVEDRQGDVLVGLMDGANLAHRDSGGTRVFPRRDDNHAVGGNDEVDHRCPVGGDGDDLLLAQLAACPAWDAEPVIAERAEQRTGKVLHERIERVERVHGRRDRVGVFRHIGESTAGTRRA